uniref:Uncharacterized protein n=1 Tax=Oreochromis aureus TaxID=47969 RepID=A0AAZ1XDY8_OREAU
MPSLFFKKLQCICTPYALETYCSRPTDGKEVSLIGSKVLKMTFAQYCSWYLYIISMIFFIDKFIFHYTHTHAGIYSLPHLNQSAPSLLQH